MEYLNFLFSSAWTFTGITLLLYMFCYFGFNFAFKTWKSFLRFLMVRKQGWPPEHLNADGDFKEVIVKYQD